MRRVWEIFCDQLWVTQILYSLEIHAFTLMSNHFHLLATTPQKNLDEIMMYCLTETSRRINLELKKQGRVFGGRYKWSVISSSEYFYKAVQYVYQNPLKAGVVTRAEDYKWSTLHCIYGGSGLTVKLSKSSFGGEYPAHLDEIEDFLSRQNCLINREIMQLGLRRAEFKIPKRVR